MGLLSAHPRTNFFYKRTDIFQVLALRFPTKVVPAPLLEKEADTEFREVEGHKSLWNCPAMFVSKRPSVRQ